MKKNLTFTENTIVAFRITRGGRFNNAGHVIFLGESEIGDYTDELYEPVVVTDAEEGTFEFDKSPEAEWTDGNGVSTGLTNAMVESGIGVIDLNGQYDTIYTMRLRDVDIDSKEYDAIFRDDVASIFDAEEARLYFICQTHKTNVDVKCYPSNMHISYLYKGNWDSIDLDREGWCEYDSAEEIEEYLQNEYGFDKKSARSIVDEMQTYDWID